MKTLKITQKELDMLRSWYEHYSYVYGDAKYRYEDELDDEDDTGTRNRIKRDMKQNDKFIETMESLYQKLRGNY